MDFEGAGMDDEKVGGPLGCEVEVGDFIQAGLKEGRSYEAEDDEEVVEEVVDIEEEKDEKAPPPGLSTGPADLLSGKKCK
jgi:hypothetical protein